MPRRVEPNFGPRGGPPRAVLELVVGHTDSRAVGDDERVLAGHDALRGYVLELVVEVLYVYDHAGAHDVRYALAQYAARQEVQYELPALVHDGVAGVVAALIAAYDVVVLAQEVDHAALALVAPVIPTTAVSILPHPSLRRRAPRRSQRAVRAARRRRSAPAPGPCPRICVCPVSRRAYPGRA